MSEWPELQDIPPNRVYISEPDPIEYPLSIKDVVSDVSWLITIVIFFILIIRDKVGYEKDRCMRGNKEKWQS